jgi:outer membrane protein assembly factor BamE (lipoprotein component of BamABCDE complex)
MLEILNLHKRSLATLLLAIMAMLMLAGCSSSDEAAQEDTSSGDTGVPCELDIMQEGCSKEDVDM